MLSTLKKRVNQRETREIWQQLTKTDKVNVSEPERLFSILTGLTLVAHGVSRRSVGSVGTLLSGGYLLYRGVAGHCPLYELAGFSSASRAEQLQFNQDHRRDDRPPQQMGARTTIEPGNTVDEAVLETMPASDPPAWTTSRV